MEVIQEDGDSGDQGLYNANHEPDARCKCTSWSKVILRALLDFGSTHNFVDSEAAARVGIKFSSRAGFIVAVANGDRVASSGNCTNLKMILSLLWTVARLI
jgi:hypothetical protein